MNPLSVFDAQKRSRFLARVGKTLRHRFRARGATTPVFVLGIQRSGTTMLMFAFHRHPDVRVYDESRSSDAFRDFRLRSLQHTAELIDTSRFPVTCFKPLADSHLVGELLRSFPRARVIWALREYHDVANSFLRKFPHATRAIRLVCSGQPGGGWFAEGISSRVGGVLRGLPWQRFTEFDFACLVWWARNSLYFENGLADERRVALLRYEQFVVDPEGSLRGLSAFLGMRHSRRMARLVHARSIAKNAHPPVSPEVSGLCEELTRSFSGLPSVGGLERT